jgi:predicted nuclease with TOPRIM domain
MLLPCRSRLQDLTRSIEADRENLRNEFEEQQIENDRLVEELEALSERLNREGHKVTSCSRGPSSSRWAICVLCELVTLAK